MNNKRELIGIWSDAISAFHCGGNGVEYIAWKGSHQIFVYSTDDYPNPPFEVIQYYKRIETLEDFDDAFYNGIKYNMEYSLEEDNYLPDNFDGVYCAPSNGSSAYDEDAMMSYMIQKYKNGEQLALTDEEMKRFRRKE